MEAMAMAAVLNSLMLAGNHEKETSEVVKNEVSTPINVEVAVDTEPAGNSETNCAVDPETAAPPDLEPREVEDDGVRMERVEDPPAFIEAKKMLHKKKFRELVLVVKVSLINISHLNLFQLL